jgi:NAD(P)-dependent dehydrogenase (short-subunit alcohol dehydrogenase family)
MGAAALLIGWRAVRRTRELRGQVVFVTGGSRGLGFLLAREFARRGCDVVICARDAEELAYAADQIDGEVLGIQCDITDRAQIEEAIRTASERFGQVDILVNNAGIIQVGPVETMTTDDFERAMAVNFRGALYATLAVLPQMRARRDGRIVNITSIGGKVAVPHLLPYDCAKFAMVGLSEGLRAELAGEGVCVTTVVPGLMRTGSPIHAEFKGDHDREFAWFTAGDLTPLSSMCAERAARKIVDATARGDAEITLGWQAKLLRLAHDLAPGLTADILGLVNRVLPDGTDTSIREGAEVTGGSLPRSLHQRLDELAARYNQVH